MSQGHGLFVVSGRRQYRGHRPGEKFEARLDAAIARAVRRGDITFLEHIIPGLQEGSYRLPDDWPPTAADTTANPRRRKAPLS